MNLGIEGRTALVCASSQGLGLACAQALAMEGVHIFLNGRDQQKLDKTASGLRETARGNVTAIAADVTTIEGQARLLAACPRPISSSTTMPVHHPRILRTSSATAGLKRSTPT